MTVIHELSGCGWGIEDVQGPDGSVAVRNLIIIHQASDHAWKVPMPVSVAEEMGAQLQGRSRIVVPPAGIEVPRNHG